MKNKIAVITAYNPRNCGMYSVDLSAKQFFDHLGVEYSIFRAQSKKHPLIKGKGGNIIDIKFQNQLMDFSKVVYWGDFINNSTYGFNDFSGREIFWGKSKNLMDSFEVWMKLFLLDGFKGDAKAYSVSNNFQTLHSISQYIDEELIKRIKENFCKNFDFIAPRDSVSIDNLKKFVPEFNDKIYSGIDAAFLLNQEEIYPSLCDLEGDSSFVYFFGRSGFENIDKTLKEIQKFTGLRAVNLTDWLSMNRVSYDLTYFKSLKSIKKASFVLTDTYHVAINSMNLGTPVVGLGLKSESQIDTCSDFKKKVLYNDLDLSKFYIEIESSDLYEYVKIINSTLSDINYFDRTELIYKRRAYRDFLLENMLKK